ncbi:MAG TPA: acyl-CoA dehydrogenase family protein [Actinomycetota bacterium]|nr:acyl-CoA dehydrogenase family protein [Actinomycetota bacterium]
MDFDLPEEAAELRGLVRTFAAEVVAPAAAGYDARGEFPLEIVRQMGSLGLFGLVLPEAYGGAGAEFITLCVAIEELARVDSSVAITLSAGVGLGAMPFALFGNEEQRQRWLPPMAAGEVLGAFGLTEASGGSDVGALRTTARREGEEWVIDGSKAFITNAGTPLSRVVTVAAATGRTERGKEISTLCVEHGTPGFTVGREYRKLGWRASDTRELAFDGCRVPLGNLVGPKGAGYRQFLQILDSGRVAIASLAVGLAQGCLDESVRYARQRTAFGQEIGAYQAVQFKLADMATRIAAARDQVYKAAWLRSQGRRFKLEASMAKLFASEVAMDSAREAVQIHGGYGFIEEFPVARHFRDAKILEIGEGTSEVQRMLIARELGLPHALPES